MLCAVVAVGVVPPDIKVPAMPKSPLRVRFAGVAVAIAPFRRTAASVPLLVVGMLFFRCVMLLMVVICELPKAKAMSHALLPEPKVQLVTPSEAFTEKVTVCAVPKVPPAVPAPAVALLRVPRLTVLVPPLTEPEVSLMLSKQVELLI